MLLRFIDESETFDSYANTTTRTLVASDDWTEINTKNLTGEQLRIRLGAAQLVGDLKAEVAKKRSFCSASQIMVVVNGDAAADSMPIAELLASAGESTIYCWQKVEAEEPKSFETLSDRSVSITSANDSSHLYGSFFLSDLGEASMPQQMAEMRQQMAEMQRHICATNLIIAHHEKEVGSLRKSLARCAETLHENPGSIFRESAAILAELVRSMLARVRFCSSALHCERESCAQRYALPNCPGHQNPGCVAWSTTKTDTHRPTAGDSPDAAHSQRAHGAQRHSPSSRCRYKDSDCMACQTAEGNSGRGASRSS
jgi:hypothetical protein